MLLSRALLACSLALRWDIWPLLRDGMTRTDETAFVWSYEISAAGYRCIFAFGTVAAHLINMNTETALIVMGKLSYEGTDADVDVNASEFKRVLSNLLNNSIEALSESRGDVRVLVQRQRKEVRIAVQDSGKGIADVDSLFVPGATEKIGGNGFGLVFAKEAVERWRGRVEVKSQLGHGTTVTLRLPSA